MWPTREQQFILSLLRFSLGYEFPARFIELSSYDLNWDDISTMSVYHGISHLLYDALNRTEKIHLPRRFEKILEAEYITNLAISLSHEKALKEIIDHFTQGGLAFVVHKGLGLSALLYPKPELRPCGVDFDILVSREDYLFAKALLKEIGYQLDQAHLEALHIAYDGELKFTKLASEKKLVVDLHTDFIANHWGKVTGFVMDSFWQHLQTVKYNDFYIPHLPVNVYLFFLCIHCAAAHNFERLIHFCDVDLFIRKYQTDINWDDIARIARENGARKALYHALNYCRKLLDTPVPLHFIEQIRPGAFSIFLVPTRLLLIRNKKPPKRLNRYARLMMLDNPLLVVKSIPIFLRRHLTEFFIKRKSGPTV